MDLFHYSIIENINFSFNFFLKVEIERNFHTFFGHFDKCDAIEDLPTPDRPITPTT